VYVYVSERYRKKNIRMVFVRLCVVVARSTPNLSGSVTEETAADTSQKLQDSSGSGTSPTVVRVPSPDDDWLMSFFACRPIRDVDRHHDVTIHDFDIVASCSAAV